MAKSTALILKTIISLVFVVVIGTPLFYIRTSVYPEVHPKMLFFQAIVEIIFFLWLFLIIKEKRYRPGWTPLMGALIFFGAALLITALTGVDFSRSFWSTQARSLGVFTFLHAIAFSLVLVSLRKEMPWRELFLASLMTSATVGIIALIQLKAPGILIPQEARSSGRPGSTFGNPTFMAGYLLYNVFVAGWLFGEGTKSANVQKQSWVFRGFCLVMFFVSVVGIFISQTRGTIIGLVIGTVFLLVLIALFSGNKKIKRSVFAVLGIMMVCVVLFITTQSNIFWKNVPLANRFREIISPSSFSQTFLPRIAALRAAGKGILERPLLGWGWENFNVVFDKFYDPHVLTFGYTETRFDKPHNFILEYFVAGGVVAGIAFLGVVLAFLYELYALVRQRSVASFAVYCVCAALVAGFVHNFFVFETLGSLLMAFLLFGWVDGQYRGTSEENAGIVYKKNQVNVLTHKGIFNRYIVASFAVGVATLPYFLNIRPMMVARGQALGFLHINNDPLLGIRYMKEAASILQPYQWIVQRDFATVSSQTYFYNSDIVPPEVAWEGLRTMEKVVAEHPYDAYNHYVLLDMYNQTSGLDPKTILPLAEKEAKIALELSPNRQEVLFSLAKTKTLEGDSGTALEILDRALALNPDVPDAHFYYGLVAYTDGKPDLGYTELKKAIVMGRVWKNNNEPRVVAGFFADSGHLDEAIPLYEEALHMDPTDLEAKIKLGVAYFLSGNGELARDYLNKAAKESDLTKSPSYAALKPILDALGIRL